MPSVTPALIWARLRAARARPAVVVLALATASVIPILVSVSAAVTADAALGRNLAALSPGDRSAIVAYNGLLSTGDTRSLDGVARRELPTLTDGAIRRQVEFRELSDSAGQTFVLAGTDDLASAVRLISGRLPTSCTPSRCEVVAILGARSRAPILRSDYGVVVVGQAVRTDPLLLSGSFDPGPQVTILLGDGVEAVAGNTPLALIQRSYGWLAPLDRRLIISQGVSAWTRTATDVANRLVSSQSGAVLVTPDQSIKEAAARAEASAKRFGLLAGGCAVLLLGSALIGGAALRPDEVRFVTALRRRGLSPGRIRAVVVARALALAVAAAVLALVAGGAVAAVLAGQAGLPAARTAATALVSALPAVLGLSVGALGLLVLTLWPSNGKPDSARDRSSWRMLTGAGLGCLMALLLLISRGSVSSSGVDGNGDPLLIALPALVLLTLALGTARTWPWVIRAAHRLAPRSAVGFRLGLAGITARPLLAASTVALLAAAVGATGFAASYRSTLGRGAADQAAFQVPMTARLNPGSGLRPVLSVASVADYQRLVPQGHAYPILRQAGSIRAGSQDADVIQFIGLNPQALGRIRRWSTVVTGSGPQTTARAVTTPAPQRGVRLPAGRTLRLDVTGDVQRVELSAWLRADDGRETALLLTPVRNDHTWTLTAALPAESGAGWTLTAISLRQPSVDSKRRDHALAEGANTPPTPSGTLGFGPILVDGAALPRSWSTWNGDGFRPLADGTTASLTYRLLTSAEVINAAPPSVGVPKSGTPIPVAADPRTAAAGPLLTLTLDGEPVLARVVATLARFPTVTGRFVIADGAALSAAIDRTSPGLGQPGEIWLDASGSPSTSRIRRELAAAPFAGVGVQWSADIEHALRTDPVASGAAALLILAAVLTLLVALAALVLLVVGERAEDAAELYTWEANGVRPGVLRRALWVRAAMVAVVAVPAGVLGGLVLTRLTARLVNVTAGAGVPQPPLVAVTGLTIELPALVIGLALALGAAGLVAATAFREPLPVLDPAAGSAR